jgi:SP family xylose:H+ symportor-like MFS transporter
MNKTSDRGSAGYLLALSLVAALGGLLFGYDTAVVSGAIGFLGEHFRLAELYSPDAAAAQLGWAASSALVGCFIGVAFAGELNDRLGRRTALLVAAVLFLVSAIGSALPRTLNEFNIYRIIGGLGVGIASMTSPMYIAEISPARHRGRMVSVNQFAIVTGMLVVYFVNYFIAGVGDHAWDVANGWRWMFGSEAVPCLLLLLALLFVPESPRFLAKQGRSEKARAVLAKVDGPSFAAAEMKEIEATLAEESSSIRDLFRPGMRVVLFLGIALAVLQQVTGINVFLYYAPEIFKAVAGTNMDVALIQTIAVGAVNLLFTIIAIGIVDKVGRKPLMIIGSAGMGLSLAAIGLAACFHAVGGWLLIFMLGYIACFALAVGPVTWVILSEIFPTKLRGRAMAICTFCLWVANYLVSQTFPMMDQNPALVAKFNHGFPFWVYGAFCVVLVWVVVRFVPETKGRSLEEIERSWKR